MEHKMTNQPVNLAKLLLNDAVLDHNYFIYENDPQKVESFEHNDAINDWLIEHVRRFNSSSAYLISSLNRMSYFGQLLADNAKQNTNQTQLPVLLREHRAACRDSAINIDILVEKIKEFCRYYFFMDREKTDNAKSWIKALNQYNKIKNWSYLEVFIKLCKSFIDNDDVKFITNIRNREVHNDSPIELIHYRFEGKEPIPTPESYIISNNDLHNKITLVIQLLIELIQSLQNVLVNITPGSIWGYLEKNNLENIIKPEERYKKEREYVKEFLVE